MQHIADMLVVDLIYVLVVVVLVAFALVFSFIIRVETKRRKDGE